MLFSPGFGSARELNAGLNDDLASRGYVVVSMSHTHESLAVEFPGGRVEPPLIDPGDPTQLKTALDARVADTRFVLDQLAAITRGHNPDVERDPLPRGLGRALDLSRREVVGEIDPALCALVKAVGYDRRVFAALPRGDVRKRLKTISEGEWAAAAVRKAISEVQAAITVAVVVPAASS